MPVLRGGLHLGVLWLRIWWEPAGKGGSGRCRRVPEEGEKNVRKGEPGLEGGVNIYRHESREKN